MASLRPAHTGHLVNRFRAVPASDDRYGLGEGPLWDAGRNRVLWVDINAGEVHSGILAGLRVIHESVLAFAGTVGAVVSSVRGELLVAGARGLQTVSPEGVVSRGTQILAGDRASRLNDGACDPAGRFLVGSLALDDRLRQEVLVRVEDDGTILVIDDDLGLANGLAFTPAGDQLYSVDTMAGIVWIRDYEAHTGAIGRRREFLRLDGKPDGLCADTEGNLWIAIWGAGEVRCYSAAGEQRALVDVAAPNTTSVAFVGAGLDRLMVTTASEELSDAQLTRYPDSGRLFIADVGVRGLVVHPWAGTVVAASTERP
jgi:sugar lactone lactonase YvrE